MWISLKSYLGLDAICFVYLFCFVGLDLFSCCWKSIQLRPCACETSYTLSLLSESSRTKKQNNYDKKRILREFLSQPSFVFVFFSFLFQNTIFSLRVHIVTCSNWFKLLLFTFARFSLTIFTATNPWDGGTHHAKTYKNSNKILGNGRYQPKIMAKITVSHKRFSLNFFCMWKLILWIL